MSTGRPETIDAVTLGVTDMARSCAFYEALGFTRAHGGPEGDFTTYEVGETYLNLQRVDAVDTRWGRVIVHVDDVDAMHRRVQEAGYRPSMAPSDAPWGERYFHVDDPDGHEVSLAKRL